ncbi:hypothetical protein EDD73_11181 [Heliophilum fasciatum]|uniref:Uncharacterized protein n=1 Tax=Heliophilum fasciatum TaxID=35700 RepID=A0A4R2RMQ3_9FIRM|nr:energy-converting hydrogenase Eha subunit B [Heliophilum fasciatum]TCP64228.1 hypothetical protein EDD73_11181 [Heliophilum fasciatum]
MNLNFFKQGPIQHIISLAVAALLTWLFYVFLQWFFGIS